VLLQDHANWGGWLRVESGGKQFLGVGACCRREGGLPPAEDGRVYLLRRDRRWSGHNGRAVLERIVGRGWQASARSRGANRAVGGQVGGCEDAVTLRQLGAVDGRLPQAAVLGHGRRLRAARGRQASACHGLGVGGG